MAVEMLQDVKKAQEEAVEEDQAANRRLSGNYWLYALIPLLGLWLAASAITFDYSRTFVLPAAGRPLPLDLAARGLICKWNEIICGLALVFLGWRYLSRRRQTMLWAAAAVGLWLNTAPLIFWAPAPAIYLNDTFCGMWVIALAVIIPGSGTRQHLAPIVPRDWTYNPSSWAQRSTLIFLSFAGLLVSRHLAAYQLGYLPHPYEPFFGAGSERVLTSRLSLALPVSDAGLGALMYTLDFLLAWMGGTARWRTSPSTVMFFALMVIPLGLVHVFLVIAQPLIIGSWCTLCVAAAAIALPMIPLQCDEAAAAVQYLRAARSRGLPLLAALFNGGPIEGEEIREVVPINALGSRPKTVLRESLRGLSFSRMHTLALVLAVWLVISPSVFGSASDLAGLNHLLGASAAALLVIAFAELARTVRFAAACLGFAAAAGVFFTSGSGAEYLNNLLAGSAILLFSLPRGRITENYGTANALVR